MATFTAEAFSHLSFNVQLERSALLLDIEERQAKVDWLESQVGSQKEALIEAIGLMVRTAECVRYGLEMGRMDQMVDDELSAPLSLVFKARDLHNNSLATIAYEKAQIEEMQKTLNDEEAWDEESTRQLAVRRAASRA